MATPQVDLKLAEYAFGKMYECMRQAEYESKLYARDAGAIDMETLNLHASNNQWYIRQAQMYAMIYLAAEMADDSPNPDKYQRVIRAVEATWDSNQIPKPRVATP